MARPKKENARRKQFRIRMTEDEHRKLAAIADHMQMDMSDAIRELLEREWVDICFELLAESEDCISRQDVKITIGYRVKFKTIGGWYNSGIIRDMDEDSYLIEVDELGCKPPKDVNIPLPYYASVLSCEDIVEDRKL